VSPKSIKFIEPTDTKSETERKAKVQSEKDVLKAKTAKRKSAWDQLNTQRGSALGKNTSLFFSSLSMLLISGNSVQEALTTLADNPKKNIKLLCETLIKDLDNGEPFWKAMLNTKSFSAYAIAMVRIGETTGTLTKSLEDLAEHDDRSRALQSKLKSAMIYPTIVVISMFVLGLVAAKFIFPRLLKIFDELKVTYGWPTKIMLGGVKFISSYAVFLAIGGFIIITAVGALAKKSPKFKLTLDTLLLRIPVIGQLIKLVEIERFGLVFGTLLNAGLSINASLKTLAETTKLTPYKLLYTKLEDNLLNGESLSHTLKQDKTSQRLLEPTTLQLIGSGEKSGSLPRTLGVISKHYRSRVEQMSNTLDQALEPLLIALVAGGVAFTALSILLPIYSIYGSFNKTIGAGPEIAAAPVLTPEQLAALPKAIIKSLENNDKVAGHLAPDTSGKIIKYFTGGEILPVRAQESKWVEVLIDGNNGLWVNKDDVDIENGK
jgi:type II secretory pathway component PulF